MVKENNINFNELQQHENFETSKIQKVREEGRWEGANSQKLPLRANESSIRKKCILKIIKLKLAEISSSSSSSPSTKIGQSRKMRGMRGGSM